MASNVSNVVRGGGVSNSGTVQGDINTSVEEISSAGTGNTSCTSRITYASGKGSVCAGRISGVTGSVGGYYCGVSPPAHGGRVGGVFVSTSKGASSHRRASPSSRKRRAYKVSLAENTPEARKALREFWASALDSATRVADSRISFLSGESGSHVVVRMTSKAASHLMSKHPLDVVPASEPRSPLSSSDESSSDSDGSSDVSGLLSSDDDDDVSVTSSSSSVHVQNGRVVISSTGGGAAAMNMTGGIIGGVFGGSRQRGAGRSSSSSGSKSGGIFISNAGNGGTVRVSGSGPGTVVIGRWDNIQSKPPQNCTVGARRCPNCRQMVARSGWQRISVDATCKACANK